MYISSGPLQQIIRVRTKSLALVWLHGVFLYGVDGTRGTAAEQDGSEPAEGVCVLREDTVDL